MSESLAELFLLRDLIALACSSESQEGDRGALRTALQALSSHRWNNPEHQIVFAALCVVGPASPNRLRRELAAQATRFGHPDVDWEQFFSDQPCTGR